MDRLSDVIRRFPTEVVSKIGPFRINGEPGEPIVSECVVCCRTNTGAMIFVEQNSAARGGGKFHLPSGAALPGEVLLSTALRIAEDGYGIAFPQLAWKNRVNALILRRIFCHEGTNCRSIAGMIILGADNPVAKKGKGAVLSHRLTELSPEELWQALSEDRFSDVPTLITLMQAAIAGAIPLPGDSKGWGLNGVTSTAGWPMKVNETIKPLPLQLNAPGKI